MRILQISLYADDLEKRMKKGGLGIGPIDIYLIVYFSYRYSNHNLSYSKCIQSIISKIQPKDKNRSLANYCICI